MLEPEHCEVSYEIHVPWTDFDSLKSESCIVERSIRYQQIGRKSGECKIGGSCQYSGDVVKEEDTYILESNTLSTI